MSTTESQFDKVAEEYDFVNALLNDYSFFESNFSSKKGRALDIGCGSGLLVEKLASYYDEVVGIDISNQMLELAKSKRQLTNTVYLNMNAEHMDFNEKFDLIVSRTTFHHLSDITSVIEQMIGLLNEDGKIVILDNVSEVETPPTYVYILGAIQEFIPHSFKFGLTNAVRIFKHNTSKSWLDHLASDKYLSEQDFYDLYGKLLPGCQFHKMGWAMGLFGQNR